MCREIALHTQDGLWRQNAGLRQTGGELLRPEDVHAPRRERTADERPVGRDCSRLVDGVLKQVGLVREALAGHGDVPIQAALCFVAADWPLIGGSFATRGVHVLWPKKLATRLAEPGVLTPETILRVQGDLATHFPPA